MSFVTQNPRAETAVNPRPRRRPLTTTPAASVSAALPADHNRTDYEVGFGRPPTRTQFKPGRSGNPRGRPKRAKGMKTITIEILTEKVAIRTAAGIKRVSKMEAVLHKLTEKAFAGDVRAQQALIVYYTKYVSDDREIETSDAASAALDQHDAAALDAFYELVRSELQHVDDQVQS